MQMRFIYRTKISDCRVVVPPLFALFSLLSYHSYGLYTHKEQKRMTFSPTVPSIDLDLAQSFPFRVPTVVFETRLFDPRIGGFSRRVEGDVVRA